jgi:hypothetical protein
MSVGAILNSSGDGENLPSSLGVHITDNPLSFLPSLHLSPSFPLSPHITDNLKWSIH